MNSGSETVVPHMTGGQQIWRGDLVKFPSSPSDFFDSFRFGWSVSVEADRNQNSGFYGWDLVVTEIKEISSEDPRDLLYQAFYNFGKKRTHFLIKGVASCGSTPCRFELVLDHKTNKASMAMQEIIITER